MYFVVKYDLEVLLTPNLTQPFQVNFKETGVWTYDLEVMGSTFHAPETLTLTTEPSRPAIISSLLTKKMNLNKKSCAKSFYCSRHNFFEMAFASN